MKDAMAQAQNNLLTPWDTYGGDWVADMNPEQLAALGQMGDYGGGRGGTIADTMYGTGMNLMPGLQQGQDLYSQVAGAGPVQSQRADLGYAAAVADNPYTQEMIDASLRDVSRNFYEDVLPDIASQSAMSGQLGSSRRGAYEAVSERGAQDRAADIAASTRGNLYQTGLQMAENQASRNFQGMTQEQINMLAAAGGLSQTGGVGADMLGNSYNLDTSNMGMALNAGNQLQGQQQSETDALISAYNLNQTLPMDQAAQAMNIASAPGGGATTASSSQGNPFSAALMGANAGMQANGLFNQPTNQGYDPTGYNPVSFTPQQPPSYNSPVASQMFPGYT